VYGLCCCATLSHRPSRIDLPPFLSVSPAGPFVSFAQHLLCARQIWTVDPLDIPVTVPRFEVSFVLVSVWVVRVTVVVCLVHVLHTCLQATGTLDEYGYSSFGPLTATGWDSCSNLVFVER